MPVDQGWEHGPGRSFLPNPAGFNPCYHAQLALASGCNAYAAPLGALEAAADILAASRLPTILKLNSHELMMPDKEDYFPAVTASVKDAVRLKCAAIGFTIYPGSAYAREMYEQVRGLATQARYHDLVVVVWAYPRGTGLPTVDDVKTDLELKDKLTPEADKEVKKSNIEIAVDVVCYAVHIAAQLGAHIIKCKPTSRLVALPDHIIRGTYEDIPINTLAERTRLVIQSAFAGQRIVINSGGEARGEEEVFAEMRQLRDGGSFGSIVGRNSFQRPYEEGVKFLHKVQDIHIGRF